jgi:hypothetical protein
MRSSDLLARPSKDQPLPWEDQASAKKLFAAIEGVQDARYGLPLPSRPTYRRRVSVAMLSTLGMLGLVAVLWIVRDGGDRSAKTVVVSTSASRQQRPARPVIVQQAPTRAHAVQVPTVTLAVIKTEQRPDQQLQRARYASVSEKIKADGKDRRITAKAIPMMIPITMPIGKASQERPHKPHAIADELTSIPAFTDAGANTQNLPSVGQAQVQKTVAESRADLRRQRLIASDTLRDLSLR